LKDNCCVIVKEENSWKFFIGQNCQSHNKKNSYIIDI
jgi:hypothetical protein